MPYLSSAHLSDEYDIGYTPPRPVRRAPRAIAVAAPPARPVKTRCPDCNILTYAAKGELCPDCAAPS